MLKIFTAMAAVLALLSAGPSAAAALQAKATLHADTPGAA